MFDNLSQRLAGTVQKLRGQGRLTEDNIGDALREVRVALLEADVALPVVKDLIARAKERAIGREVQSSIKPGQALVKVVHDELVAAMGGVSAPLDLQAPAPVVVLLAGLQGAGKTTSAAKLARYLTERQGKRVLMVSCDVYRPAAMQQLETLAGQIGVDCRPAEPERQPDRIAAAALEEARRGQYDVLLVDTAGRMHVDEAMMAEIQGLHRVLEPHETLFVVDAMTGQDAANTARAFNDSLPLSGVVLTKADGDARGGAALSVRAVTGKPIKFLGVSEKLDGIEAFDPERLASRILGMGDVVGLVAEVERKVDREKSERLARKLQKGRKFDLEDFRDQLQQMDQLGGMGAMLEKLPGAGQLPETVRERAQAGDSRRMIAIVNSMTPQERRFPDIIRGSRKRRIAHGSGSGVQDVNKLLKQYQQMQKMMKKLARGGAKKMMRQMGGKLPPGFMQ